MKPNVSIIIPTFNEVKTIGTLVAYLKKNNATEIIISDGGSTDGTIDIALKHGIKFIQSPKKGRAAQLNYGASFATGNILYFVHADTFPPENFIIDIITAIKDGYQCGRYRTKFDSSKWILKVNAFFTKFDWFICYGGDQTFFITERIFTELGGYNSNMQIMEEYDLTERAKQIANYKIFKKATLISARKYEGKSWLKVQLANRKAIQLYKKGATQNEIAMKYKAMLE